MSLTQGPQDSKAARAGEHRLAARHVFNQQFSNTAAAIAPPRPRARWRALTQQELESPWLRDSVTDPIAQRAFYSVFLDAKLPKARAGADEHAKLRRAAVKFIDHCSMRGISMEDFCDMSPRAAASLALESEASASALYFLRALRQEPDFGRLHTEPTAAAASSYCGPWPLLTAIEEIEWRGGIRNLQTVRHPVNKAALVAYSLHLRNGRSDAALLPRDAACQTCAIGYLAAFETAYPCETMSDFRALTVLHAKIRVDALVNPQDAVQRSNLKAFLAFVHPHGAMLIPSRRHTR